MSQDQPTQPIQQPLPLAFIHGQPYLDRPEDLYIPPEALEVFLETFEGPLDLLLYLIRREKVDILDLPVAAITAQYMEYVELMGVLKLELAAEYLVMAAVLAEIKSRLLLPRRENAEEDEADPRAELIRRLQEYEVIKAAAQDVEALPRMDRDTFLALAEPGDSCKPVVMAPEVSSEELMLAFAAVLKRAAMFKEHAIEREKLSTRARMAAILERLEAEGQLPFGALFTVEEGRAGVVVTFVAMLELTKLAAIRLIQTEPFTTIRVEKRQQDDPPQREGNG